MAQIKFTANEIGSKLLQVAKAFGPPSKDTILFENYGKHLFEVDLTLKKMGERGSILDVGGGLGVNLQCIQRLTGQSHELYLIDNFEEYAEDNRMGHENKGLMLMEESKISVVNQDFWYNPKLPFESKFFDVVTIFDVIEHLPGHPMKLLREINRVLKEGGKILLSGPNLLALMKKVKFLLLGEHPYMRFEVWIEDKYYSHYREYTQMEYYKLLELSGFNHIQSKLVSEPSKTRALNRYYNGKHGIISLTTIALYGVYLLDSIFPFLRPSVYCVGEK